MKPPLAYLIVVLVAAGAGAGGAYGVVAYLKPPAVATAGKPADPAADPDEPLVILPASRVLAPLVFPDGRLAGYANFSFQLEVAEKDAARVTEDMPVLINAINMRTYRTAMARDPDGQIPDLDILRRTIEAAHREAFGAGIVRRVLVVDAMPEG
jgi:hypothetical protein